MNEDQEHRPVHGAQPVRVSSLRELPREAAPARDLWPAIAARLQREGDASTERFRSPSKSSAGPADQALRCRQPLLAAVCLLVALAVAGTLAVRLHRGGPVTQIAGPAALIDTQYLKQRPELLSSLNARLAGLPPGSRQKVLEGLNVIEGAIQDVQVALGRDPGNALLRTLLQDSYQDEQHLLLTVQEARAWTQQATARQRRS